MSKISVIFMNLLAYLPFPIIYILSDYILYPIVRFIIQYRRKVVKKNLEFAFPEKNEKERSKIENKFYHHLCDVLVETTKMRKMSANGLRRRYTSVS